MPTFSEKRLLLKIKKMAFGNNELMDGSQEHEFNENKRKCEDDFYEFFKQAWHVVEGDEPLIDGLHLEACIRHIEASIRGEIRNLLINIPPRTAKSTLVSVMFPAFLWIKHPEEKLLYASYSLELSREHSLKCRRLIESEWYQDRWGSNFKMVKDQNTKSYFINDKGGFRKAVSAGSSVTGSGGSYLIGDDLNNAKDGESEVKRQSIISWWKSTWSTRLNNRQKGKKIVIAQRLHTMDITGYLLETAKHEWVHLRLPLEFEINNRSLTVPLAGSEQPWEDWRKEEGEPLWTGINPNETLKLKIELGSYNYAGQYQQRPAPEAGGIIEKAWFQWWKEEKPPKLDFVVQSWDTAFTVSESSAYSACTTWGIFKREGISNLLLLSSWRGKVSFPDLLKRAARLHNNWTDIGTEKKPFSSHTIPDDLIIEAKASGHSLAAEFIAKGIPAQRFNPDKYGDKIQRVHKIIPYIETGLVWVAAKAPNYLTLRGDHELLVENCAIFPNAESRDLVDSMTQAFLYLIKEKGLLKHRMDLGFSNENILDSHKPGFKQLPIKENKSFFGSSN